MVENIVVDQDRFKWHLPVYAALGTTMLFFLFALGPSRDDVFLYLLAAVPISIFSLLSLIGKKRRHRRSIISMLVVYLVISVVFVGNYSTIRDASRWLIWSHGYKVQVLAQPASPNGGLKHAEWDGWGFAGMDTTVYVVFDPTDSLSAAALSRQPGKFNGIPCEVPLVHRLENHWYAVRFYTDEYWGQRNNLDCREGPEN